MKASARIKEKRRGRFSPFDLQSDFEQCGGFARVLIKEKRRRRFSPPDLKEQIRAVVVRGTSVYFYKKPRNL